MCSLHNEALISEDPSRICPLQGTSKTSCFNTADMSHTIFVSCKLLFESLETKKHIQMENIFLLINFLFQTLTPHPYSWSHMSNSTWF